jgi:hypothetical protein
LSIRANSIAVWIVVNSKAVRTKVTGLRSNCRQQRSRKATCAPLEPAKV